jgi:hypothetical protein
MALLKLDFLAYGRDGIPDLSYNGVQCIGNVKART